MKLVYTCELRIDKKFHMILELIRIHASKFYNMTLYEHKEKNFLSLNDYYYMFSNHLRCDYLQKHTYMHAIKQAMKDAKSFYALHKKYQKNPDKNQAPGFPKFRGGHRLLAATFMKTGIRIRSGKVLLSIGKKMKSDYQMKCIAIELPEKVNDFLSDKHVKMVMIKPSGNKYEVKFVYEIEDVPLRTTGDIMGIDLGVNNLAAITFMNHTDQLLIDGRGLKSKIATFNKKMQILLYLSSRHRAFRLERTKVPNGKEMICTGSEHYSLTKKSKRLYKKRNGTVDYYIHKASKMIVDIAINHDVKEIVIGDLTNLKKENKQKYFVQIPHTRLVNQIKYKSKRSGIHVVMQEEAYTSSVSSLDLEPVEKTYANKKRRKVRGLFETSYGDINSDINGSVNILRKRYKENIPRLILSARDKGIRENPKRLLIA